MTWEEGWCGKRKILYANNKLGVFLMRIKNAPAHYHKRSKEWYVCIKGRGKMRINNKSRFVKEGDVVEINTGLVHGLVAEKEMMLIVVSMPLVTKEDHYI